MHLTTLKNNTHNANCIHLIILTRLKNNMCNAFDFIKKNLRGERLTSSINQEVLYNKSDIPVTITQNPKFLAFCLFATEM